VFCCTKGCVRPARSYVTHSSDMHLSVVTPLFHCTVPILATIILFPPFCYARFALILSYLHLNLCRYFPIFINSTASVLFFILIQATPLLILHCFLHLLASEHFNNIFITSFSNSLFVTYVDLWYYVYITKYERNNEHSQTRHHVSKAGSAAVFRW
jgi:hypothetical protein